MERCAVDIIGQVNPVTRHPGEQCFDPIWLFGTQEREKARRRKKKTEPDGAHRNGMYDFPGKVFYAQEAIQQDTDQWKQRN